MMCSVAYATTGTVLLATSGIPMLATLSSQKVDAESATTQLETMQALPATLASMKAPLIMVPEWLRQQNTAEAAATSITQRTSPRVATVTYEVTTKGSIAANIAEFRAQAQATLNDSRGWARLGVNFQEVASGGMFTLVLSEAAMLPAFSSGCGTEYSCRAGRYVIINQDRWLGATTSWNSAGGSLRDYRHMVINHETGHWLGHGHENCGAPGAPAMVMQQQSIDLQGCTFNPWPTEAELWSTQLGIKR